MPKATSTECRALACHGTKKISALAKKAKGDVAQMLNSASSANTSNFSTVSSIKPARETSPCTVACPIHTDAQGYVSLIAQGRYADALNLIRETNPLPSVLARICAHPCETKCRRAQVDAPIAICALKRVAVERGWAQAKSPEPQGKLEKRVAIVGSGPSGLTAAYDLALLGYQVIVFEKNEQVGGALRYGIPIYRLPREELDRDLREFAKLGVEFRTGVQIGKHVTLEELKAQYDAVLIAVGLSVSRGLPIPGADSPDVYLALPFLAGAAAGKCPFGKGRNVIVVGGGNVAFDVARSALRLGAAKVRMACLEYRHEMPAWPWEIEEAEEEGIELNPGWGPKAILNEDGKIKGLEVVRVKAVFDAEGRFNPTFYENQTKSIEGDVVIFAIGQASDLSLAQGTSVQLTPKGLLVFDKDTMSTTQPGIFACGEVVTGPGSAVAAMANGRRAARAIAAYLAEGRVVQVQFDEPVPVRDLTPETIAKVRKEQRVPMPMVPPQTRIKNFEQIELGYSEEAAIREAQRCLLCAVGAQRRVPVCPDCLTCVRICPFGVPIATEKGVQIRLDQCQSCGICATRCPGQLINLTHFSLEEIAKRVKLSLNDVKNSAQDIVVLGFVCRYYSGSANVDGQMPHLLEAEGIRIVELPCTGRVDIGHILLAFECGADGVFVTGCSEENCHFREGTTYSQGVVKQAQSLINAAGLGSNRVEMIMLASHDAKELLDRAREVRQRLAAAGRSPLRAKA